MFHRLHCHCLWFVVQTLLGLTFCMHWHLQAEHATVPKAMVWLHSHCTVQQEPRHQRNGMPNVKTTASGATSHKPGDIEFDHLRLWS